MSSYDFEWIQWKAESGGNGHWYAVVGEQGDPIFWTDAREAAANLGAETHLATITSAAENTFIFDSLVRDRPEIMHILLGGEQRPEAGEPDQGWTWVTGEEFAYTNWAWGEPNDYDGLEDWLLGYRDGS